MVQDPDATLPDNPVHPEGIFRFALVPEGDYVLRVWGSDVVYDGLSYTTVQGYETSTQSVSLSKGMDDIVVQLKAKTAK